MRDHPKMIKGTCAKTLAARIFVQPERAEPQRPCIAGSAGGNTAHAHMGGCAVVGRNGLEDRTAAAVGL